MNRLRGIGLCMVLLTIALGPASLEASLDPEAVPAELAPWRAWVLHGNAEALCPTAYNDGAVLHCRWPSRLELEVFTEGGRFEQRWLIFSRGWVTLPGGPESWPDAVSVDGASMPVIDRGGVPMVELLPGEHRVMGRFFWSRRPEVIAVPPELGLLSLSIDGRRIPAPVVDGEGRLWIQKGTNAEAVQDHLETRIFRLINDTVPLQVTTLLRLSVSGGGREEVFDPILPETAVPMDLASRLPVRLESDGRLRVQARAGQWEIRIDARLPGPVRKLTAPDRYGDEIWSFRAQHDLRLVEIVGVPAVAPTQTELPDEWRAWPAFLVKAGASVEFKEIRRGNPDPNPDQLNLHRILWLDFDGRGFTAHDRIDGTLSRSWRMTAKAMALGRVNVNGQDQVITRLDGSEQPGIELRQGRLEMSADSRVQETGGRISAVGWDLDFQEVDGLLHLPPGWRLLTAAGVDQISESWVQQWTLLDFFLVLIIALAVFKLRGWRWGLVALGVMILVFHEPGAPRIVWLHLAAVLALWPRLPYGWVKKAVCLWGLGASAVLLATAIPFMVHQLRWGIYPQLADDRMIAAPVYRTKAVMPESLPSAPPQAPIPPGEILKKDPARPQTADDRPTDPWRHDPNALIPTGPGLPDWQWRTIALQWNGPVTADQDVRFYLLSPRVNLLLAFLRVGLLAALIFGLFDWRTLWNTIRKTAPGATVLILTAWCAGGLEVAAAQAETAFPPPVLLDEFRQRLLEKPDCLPYCADTPRIELSINGDVLQLVLKINAARRTAVPLPVDRNAWTPEQILLDNAPAAGLTRTAGGQLWAFIPQGLHTMVLTGSVNPDGVVQIPLPMRPHTGSFTAPGWEVKGIQADGRVDSSLHLTRLQPAEGGPTAQPALPAFLQVERELQLDLSWQIQTTVRRMTPPGAPIVVAIPLLPGESITTGGVVIDQNQALIHLAAHQIVFTYTSDLAAASEINLTAPRGVPWTEIWRLNASPVWHCALEGIPVTHHQDAEGRWNPQWHPWPGEKVTIRVTRPPAVPGQHLTIERSDLILTPGMRFLKGELTVQIRSSRGGQYTVTLPPKANLQSVAVDGRTLPASQDGAFITIPLRPGGQRISLQWHQPVGFAAFFKAPAVGIGAPAVNARVTLQMPAKRWILLTGGPRWGPAVLFWSYLMVIVLAALALGRNDLTPLKTWQWLLLGLGLTQVPPVMALIIVGWLLAVGIRDRRGAPAHRLAFDGMQIALAVWTLAALISLFAAVKAGLVGQPEMQIHGNDSDTWTLNWTQDRVADSMPRPWVLSLPLWVFRTLMLGWALWLAWSLLVWLQWTWKCFSRDGLWRSVLSGRGRAPSADAGSGAQPSS